MATAIKGNGPLNGITFDVTGQVNYKSLSPHARSLSITDRSGSVLLSIANDKTDYDKTDLGDRIRAQGRMVVTTRGFRIADCFEVRRFATGAPPPTIEATGIAVAEGKCDFQVVRIIGVVRDAFPDDIDAKYTCLVVNSEGVPTTIPLSRNAAAPEQVSSYIGAKVAVTGYCNPSTPPSRPFGNRIISIASTNDIRVLRPTNQDIGQTPDIVELKTVCPHVLYALGPHKAIGRVIAAWNGDSALIRTISGTCCRVRLDGDSLPSYGDYICAIGLPVTDFFRINLQHAIWQKHSDIQISLPEPKRLTGDEILQKKAGRPTYRSELFGSLLRLRGEVLNTQVKEGNLCGLLLKCGTTLVEVDCETAAPSAERTSIGAVIDVCGTYVFDTDEWTPFNSFPMISGHRLILRHADDLQSISSPPWWTPRKAVLVMGLLLFLLTILAAWHLLQRHIAKLRLSERTRLAVELHDSVSQNLTGVSLQIDAARQLADSNPSKLKSRLVIASRTIDACREELKNCICDLRSRAFDVCDMKQAIEETLSVQRGTGRISIRFNVRRKDLTDSSVHAILRIVRELVSNALRHGKATAVAVAGTCDNGEIRFSVKDNGCGFSPAERPGVTSGHFGLDGIQERVRSFGGSMRIESAADCGTRVEITLKGALRK